MPQDTKYGRVVLENPRNIGQDEPLFILRAQDRFALKLLKVYRYFCELGGSPQNHLDTLDETALRFHEWQAEHPVKTPDSVGFEPQRRD